MKSKNLKSKENNVDISSKSFDFINYYKSATETTVKLKSSEDTTRQDVNEAKIKPIHLSASRKQNKRKQNPPESVSMARNIEAIDNANAFVSNAHLSTIDNIRKKDKSNSKPIIKSANDCHDSSPYTSESKPKKRNKSVSFVLENEEVAVKKVKSEKPSMSLSNNIPKKKDKKKLKKYNTAEKENKSGSAGTMLLNNNNKKDLSNGNMQMDLNVNIDNIVTKTKSKKNKNKGHNTHQNKELEETQNGKLSDKVQSEEKSVSHDVPANNKTKKKKQSVKPKEENIQGQPQNKSRKRDAKPDVVAEDLENLIIGDNTHTLTNLLDDMAVADKKKHKKNKKNLNRSKQPVVISSTGDQKEGKIKEKWTKKRWNKNKKPHLEEDQVSSSVVIDNLPIKIMLEYKKLLAEHFSKCGTIKGIGVAEVYPSEDPKPVFTTTINFENEAAAEKALDEDNTPFKGNNIRVKQPLPPAETTLVVRSYAELSSQALSSTFGGAGRIRNIRHLVKGKKSMATGFVEFDGPVALNRAFQLAEGVKIDNKRIYVSKFEARAVAKPAKAISCTLNKNDKDSSDSSDN